jgi:cytochrome c oxidase assembly factor CtaG
MLALTLVDLEYETSVSIWEFEMMILTKMIVLPSFQLATRLNSQNTNETDNINELLSTNLFMYIGNSN